MIDTSNPHALKKKVSTDYDTTIGAIKAALAEQGFGILTEIDVAATLKKKLDVDTPRAIILGACNPKLAHRAMSLVPDVSVFLPCNVVVRENNGGEVEIAALNPETMGQMIANPGLVEVADEANKRIRAAIDAVN
ncbi:hypothetical protein SIID45300_00700 [Candidatus Magnetaquicoccaceae bacterium FCR-1]|uniref:DUF302 domain-containing protein n=1 Tax=Candidatus Magnetaquiglobus chichijimensis TaxID=3141448 RepID=A0ABQ0C674_9PROT